MANQKQYKQLTKKFGADYRQRKARLKFVENERKYYITDKNEKEYNELRGFIDAVDYIIESMPYPHSIIIRRTILEDVPTKQLEDELGYNYIYLCNIRAEGRRLLIYAITGVRLWEVNELSKLLEERLKQ